MKPRLITFDCAATLVEANWTIDGFLADCARDIGLQLDAASIRTYRDMFVARQPEFLEINLTRDPARGKGFWDRLAEDWIHRLGLPASCLAPLLEASERLAFGPNSILFRLYEDVTPCLDQLRAYRLAVISNWDYSLHRVLRITGIADRFELVLASLEEGVEKPDPRLFHICLERTGVDPNEVVHVGDNPIDDGEGAAAAGIRSLILDRTLEGSRPGFIRSLSELQEAVACLV